MTLDTTDLIPTHALSIKPAWAWLIIHAGKDFENRVWKPTSPNRRTVQAHAPFRVFVHASHETRKEHMAAQAFVEQVINPSRADADFAPIVLPSMAELRQGGIIGAVTILRWMDQYTGDWATGPGLLLADPEPRPFLPCNGQLNFFLPNL
jgi:hypothetical protein